MKSTTERSYGSRLENARKLKTNLQSFTDYQPASGECSIEDFDTCIQTIVELNPAVATALIGYRQSVSERRIIFTSSPLSIKKIITPINAYNRAKFGKTSTSYIASNVLVKKIRGTQLKAKKALDAASFSVSQQSYGSITLNFQNLIANQENLGASYVPANQNIKIEKLKELELIAIEKNNNVVTAFSVLGPKQDARFEAYDKLAAKAIRIKDFVQSQYGISSSEYKLIKGLKI
jgi:hypothetical protein